MVSSVPPQSSLKELAEKLGLEPGSEFARKLQEQRDLEDLAKRVKCQAREFLTILLRLSAYANENGFDSLVDEFERYSQGSPEADPWKRVERYFRTKPRHDVLWLALRGMYAEERLMLEEQLEKVWSTWSERFARAARVPVVYVQHFTITIDEPKK